MPIETADADDVSEFVKRFAAAWRDPTTAAINALLHEDVQLTQPMEPMVTGHDQTAGMWDRIFELMPDLKGQVLSWGSGRDAVYIELLMRGTFGGRPLEWVTLDRIHLQGGLVRQRTAYFDPLPLIAAIALRPTGLLAWSSRRVRRLIGTRGR